jgi:hypothetical protein
MKRVVLVLIAVLAITGSALTASEPPAHQVAAAARLCQFCMQEAGEVCSYAGQPCGIGGGCTCTPSGGSLACCVG